jgi:signal transduction histidine kinase
VPRRRAFWGGFAAGWTVYTGLLLTFELSAQPGAFLRPLLMALVNAAPYVGLSAIVAANRDRLLRLEWSPWKTVGVHLGIGVVFAFTSAALVLGIAEATGLRSGEFASEPWAAQVVLVTVTGLFLYLVFLGVLLWSESRHRVRESHEAAAREAVLRAQAEARALRAQFNPHFVFNTLHSLMLLVRSEPSTAERALEDVATLIRYASIIQREDLDAVPLGTEVEVARRYVGLEKLRLSERLTVKWHLDPAALRSAVPPFSVQTLVENAVKHGIEPQVRGGTISVRATESGGTVTIEVADDGGGADTVRVEAATGHGLDLLRRRFESRYGDAGDVRWTSAPDEGFEVTLRLPAETPPASRGLGAIEVRREDPVSTP